MSSAAVTMIPAGGIPDNTDVVLCGIFIALFFSIGLYFHFRIFRAYGKKFVWSGLCFSYSMARIAALSLRIGVVKHPQNKTLNLVAQILIAAGVALLYVVNLQMSRRFFGQLHPRHSIPVKRFVTGTIILIIPVLAMVIATVVQSYITHDPHILSIDRKIRLVASTIFVFLPFIPIPVIVTVLVLKAMSPGGLAKSETLAEGDMDLEAIRNNSPMDLEKQLQLGPNDNTAADTATLVESNSVLALQEDGKPEKTTAEWTRIKGEPESGFGPAPVTTSEILETAAVILVPAILLTLEQGIRCAQAYYVPKAGMPIPWFMTKATFWVCIFGLEITSVLIFGLAVLPRRFSHLRIV